MKIIGGQFKGKNFYMPAGIRPTQNRTRKALFDILGQDLTGVHFLDLFAGSGAMGLEAFSRGAHKVICVEKEQKIAYIIEKNITLFNIKAYDNNDMPLEVIHNDAFLAIKLLARQNKRFDYIFLDPPYGRELVKKSLKTLDTYDILQPNCMVIIQHDVKEILPESLGRFLLFRKRKYGSSFISFFTCR